MKRMLIVLLILNFHSVSAEEQRGPYSFAIVPQLPALTLHSYWKPFVDRLTVLTGYKFNLLTYPGFAKYEADVSQGNPDFVYMNPYTQALLKESVGYMPIIRDQKQELSGILVVKADSDIQSLKDLDGKTLAFPSPNAFAASLYMRALLAEKEKLEIKPVYVNTHANVYRTVIYGQAMAGGGVNKTFITESDAVKKQLKILYTTPPVAPHPISVHPRVDRKIARDIQSAILSMTKKESDRKLLHDIHIPAPIEADYQRDYLPLNDLNLDSYIKQEL